MDQKKILANIPVGMIAPKDFVEHPLHNTFFLDPEKKKKQQSYYDSIGKYGKVKQVVYVEIDGKKMVIDGWSYIKYAIAVAMPVVPAYRLYLTEEADIARIMLELQFSDHNSVAEEYKIYKAAHELFSKGKGYRSDLDEDMDKAVELRMADKKSDRRPDIYDKIAAMTAASSGKRVSQIIKIGNERPALLERIENGAMSVSGAYKSVTKKDKPIVDLDKKSLTSSSAKEVPQDPKGEVAAASQNDASADLTAAQTASEEALANKESVEAPILEVNEDDDNIIIQSVCKCCNSPIHILFPKEMLYDTHAAA